MPTASSTVGNNAENINRQKAESDRPGSHCQVPPNPRYRNNIAIVLCGQPAARCNWAAVIVGRLTYGRNIEELSGALFLNGWRQQLWRQIPDTRATTKVRQKQST